MKRDLKSNILELERLDTPSRIHAVLGAALKKSLGDSCLVSGQPLPLWSADFFGLSNAKAFKNASAQEQQAILEACSLGLLEESLFIEQNGMAFATKMSMLSETIEERMLYNLFAGDEAMHYHHVRSFVPVEGTLSEPNGFHHMLEEIILEGDRDSLVFIIQVVLEGWGLTHYKSLSKGCESSTFQNVLSGILRDEARHRGSGLVLHRDRGMNGASQAYVTEVMTKFLGMVAMGPQSVVESVDTTCGLTRHQRIELFSELETELHSAQRLARLRILMNEDGTTDWMDELDKRGCFKPLKPEQCA